MGLLDNYLRLVDMGKKSQDSMDVGGRMSDMQSKLNGLNASMAAQNTAATAAADPASQARRVEATATVTAARLQGTIINTAQAIELDLLVMLPGGIPMPVTQMTMVTSLQIGRVQPGAQVPVSLDPSNPMTLAIDWQRAAA